MAEDAERIPGTERVNNMIQERMTRRIRQLEEEKLFAEMQASKEHDERRKTPEQKVGSSIKVLEEEKPLVAGTSPEVDGTSSVTDDIFARAWSGEFGRKLCGIGARM